MKKNTDESALKFFFDKKEKGVFLYSGAGRRSSGKNMLFTGAVKHIRCIDKKRVNGVLDEIDSYLAKGYYFAGYLSYEAGYGTEKKFARIKTGGAPLICGGIYRGFKEIPHGVVRKTAGPGERFFSYGFSPSMPRKRYKKAFEKIKKLIKQGEAYQVNFCFKINFRWKGLLKDMFFSAAQRQKTPYCAFINDGERVIMSFSPELFFRAAGRRIFMKPMKGTVIKENTGGGGGEFLRQSIKNRAENVMIVDLIRSDLGRICETNTVKVKELFKVEEYKTVFQMTSTVAGRLKKEKTFGDIIRAVYPCGSVTGAPKIRAMQIIKELEESRRGVYTGAVGFASKSEAVFNIPIRTPVLKGDKGEMGAGSGIVYDSSADREYEECLGKTVFFEGACEGFGVIESFLYENGKLFLSEFHFDRLKRSLKEFGIRTGIQKVRKVLKKQTARLDSGKNYKVRVIVDRNGGISAGAEMIRPVKGGEIAVSEETVDHTDVFLRHKTTVRRLYDSEYEKYRRQGFADVIFMNEKEEVTEAHSSNIVIRKSGRFYTPPVSCGLLPGVYRRHLVETGKCRVKKVFLKDLYEADEIFLCNSVRRMAKVFLQKR
ncbi:MAG: chorismate-binding protein [Candidatus Goldiibacteriota bacterium]